MSDEEDGYMSSEDNSGERMLLIQAELAAREKEALEAIKEDICAWLCGALEFNINGKSFMDALDTGIVMCKLAAFVQSAAKELAEKAAGINIPMTPLNCNSKAEPGSFFARDNTSNFIEWCRKLGMEEAVIFESEGLVLHKDEKRVILCLLDVARFAERIGIPPPQLVKMEREIEQLEAKESSEIEFCSKCSLTNISVNDSITTLTTQGECSPQAKDCLSTRALSGSSESMQEDLYKSNDLEQSTEPILISHCHHLLSTSNSPPKTPAPSRIPVMVKPPSKLFYNPPQAQNSVPTTSANPSSNHWQRNERKTKRRMSVERVEVPTCSTRLTQKRKRDEIEDQSVAKHTPKRQRVESDSISDTSKDEKKGDDVVIESVGKKVMRRVDECTCNNKFKMEECGNGRFVVHGASGRKMAIYARLLSDRVMVRVGGGWDSLDSFLLKNDPCRIHAIRHNVAGKPTQ